MHPFYLKQMNQFQKHYPSYLLESPSRKLIKLPPAASGASASGAAATVASAGCGSGAPVLVFLRH